MHEDVLCKVLKEKDERKTRVGGGGAGSAEAFVLGLHNNDSCRPQTGARGMQRK